jgi:hypothetical protein
MKCMTGIASLTNLWMCNKPFSVYRIHYHTGILYFFMLLKSKLNYKENIPNQVDKKLLLFGTFMLLEKQYRQSGWLCTELKL